MQRKLALIVLLAALLVPVSGHALGLGEIRVRSGLNQALEAEIALMQVGAGELDGLQVRLAPSESFQRIGLDRPFILTQLRFEVGQDAAGNLVVKVTTREPVREPFLNFLVEATWSRGRLLREYTILLDPPVLMPATVAPVRVPDSPRPATSDHVTPEPAAPARVAPAASWQLGDRTWGPVRRDDTLWSIAQETRPDGLSVNQMMLAIFEANPEAIEGNINRLRAGHILRIPDLATAGRLTQSEAAAEVRRQNDAWRMGETTEFRVSQVGPEATDSRLRLVAPGMTTPETDLADRPGTSEEVTALRAELAAIRQALDDERMARDSLASRLVEVESQATDLQRRLELADRDLAAVGRTTVEPPAREVTPPPLEPDLGIFGLMSNPLVLAVLLGVPVIGALIFVAMRRRREATAAREAMRDAESDDATRFPTYKQPAEEADLEATQSAPSSSDAATIPAAAGAVAVEADFHLAYGHYDQAAELMEAAVLQSPERVPFVVKLLEIYFAWDKADEFIRHARTNKSMLEAAGEWANIAVMGKQLGGADDLFAGMDSTLDGMIADLDTDFTGGDDAADLDAALAELDIGDASSEIDAEAPVSGGSDSRLDLARAYIDMGDADGARSLLEEVIADGDEGQKREAKELLDLFG